MYVITYVGELIRRVGTAARYKEAECKRGTQRSTHDDRRGQ